MALVWEIVRLTKGLLDQIHFMFLAVFVYLITRGKGMAERNAKLQQKSQADFDSYVANYGQIRGMDFYHDVHDWLGGWPYESISPEEVNRLMRELGMREVRAFIHPRKELGLFGSGCDEFVYEKAVMP